MIDEILPELRITQRQWRNGTGEGLKWYGFERIEMTSEVESFKAKLLEEVKAAKPESKVRVDDAEDEFGSFCITCGLSTDTDTNTGKCYCDWFNAGIDKYEQEIVKLFGLEG